MLDELGCPRHQDSSQLCIIHELPIKHFTYMPGRNLMFLSIYDDNGDVAGEPSMRLMRSGYN